jgi:hypothetical protein
MSGPPAFTTSSGLLNQRPIKLDRVRRGILRGIENTLRIVERIARSSRNAWRHDESLDIEAADELAVAHTVLIVDTEINRFLRRLVNLVAFQPHLKPAIFSSTEEGLVRSERARARLILRVFSLKNFSAQRQPRH